MVHDDDFAAVGERDEIKALWQQVAARFTVADKVIGLRMDLGEGRDFRILNRIIRAASEG